MSKTNIFLILLLVISLFLRTANLSSTFYVQDLYRDYIVGKHIIENGEAPLNGPSGQFPNSPAYYYFIAFLLYLSKNIGFMNFANILIQVANIFFIFKIGDNLFGRRSAIVSSVLFAFSDVVFGQSQYIWQPYVMQSFLNLSLLLLIMSLIKKNANYIYISGFVFVLAGAFHNSSFALSPIYILVSIWILIAINAKLLDYIVYVVVLVSSGVLFYAPLYYGGIIRADIFSHILDRFSGSSSGGTDIIGNLLSRTNVLAELVFIRHTILFLTGGLILSVAYLVFQKVRIRTYVITLLLLAIIQFMVVVATFDVQGISFPERYLMPIYGIIFVILGELVSGPWPQKIKYNLVALVVGGLFFWGISNAASLTTGNLNYNFAQIYDFAEPNTSKDKISDPLVGDLVREINNIKDREDYSDFDFFDFQSYYNGNDYPYNYVIFWSQLEDILDRQFIKISDFDYRGYETLNDKSYIFLICLPVEYVPELEKCRNTFGVNFPDYKIGQALKGGFYDIYVTKKISK